VIRIDSGALVPTVECSNKIDCEQDGLSGYVNAIPTLLAFKAVTLLFRRACEQSNSNSGLALHGHFGRPNQLTDPIKQDFNHRIRASVKRRAITKNANPCVVHHQKYESDRASPLIHVCYSQSRAEKL
jgi:hypothetical protein